METIIRTENLTKRYGKKFAVQNASLHVGRGEIYGLIGKNGAGKTTLMKMLLGMTAPTSGDIELLEGEKDARAKIGSLIETPGLYKNETALENMRRFALLSPTPDWKIREILDLVGLADTGRKKAGAFSLGMRQRLGIAVALLGDPEIMILDEPINGLDPAGIREVRDLILYLNRLGVTFVISSHLLDELGRIATCYGIMDNGRLIEEISVEKLKEKCLQELQVRVDRPGDAYEILKKVYPELPMQKRGKQLEISHAADPSIVSYVLARAGIRVYGIENSRKNFEDYYFERVEMQ